MRISDAAVKGRELLEPKQGNDLFEPEDGTGKYGGCYRGMCLVGAEAIKLPIMDANADEEGYDLTDVLLRAWPWVGGKGAAFYFYPCACTMIGPNDEPAQLTAAHIIAHLWDVHANGLLEGECPTPECLDDPWTFERITDWLRSIEPQDEPTTTPQA